MANPSTSIPELHRQPASVDFIDNCLPYYHDAFRNQPVRYDQAVQQYVPNTQPPRIPLPALALPPPDGEQPAPTAIEAMRFWSFIFADAMKTFNEQSGTEPADRHVFNCSIRTQKGWDGVYSQLQKARERYDGTKQGFWGRCKRGARKLVDQSASVKQAVRFVPDVEYVSPVLATVEVVLEAAETASEVREKVKAAFDGEKLGKMFGDIELFLATFPGDEKVREASIDLVVSVFSAIEETIGFFLMHQARRGLSALGRGKNYQAPLLEKINLIQQRSDFLIHQAQKSHVAHVRADLKEILSRTWSIEGVAEGVVALQHGVAIVIDKVDESNNTALRIYNSVKGLLDVAEKSFKTQQDRIERLQEVITGQNGLLAYQNNLILGRLTPPPPPSFMLWHAPQHQLEYSANSNRPSTPQQQQQLLWSPPSPQQQTITPPHHYQHQLSPHPISPPHHQQQHYQQTTTQTSVAQFISLLNLPDPSHPERDISAIVESQYLIPLSQRTRAEQALDTLEFQRWITCSGSTRLLIHGDCDRTNPPLVTGLSLACATLAKTLQDRPYQRYIPLVFFCGLHVEVDDPLSGGEGILRSFIAQFLRQCPTLCTEENLQIALRGEYVTLLRNLIASVPEEAVVVLVIDGAVHYETKRFETDMLEVIRAVLGMEDTASGVAVKVLVTSPIATEHIWKEFSSDTSDSPEGSVLEIDGLPVVF
ncbi:hypothetical protein QBC35DRAFT_29935 [Podospora australis]|uniref:Uncharacterized protein n=1 Tax=Podospora australis TaxID=1536484 RepID=A0AAN6WRJ3_9PEZI|nr:hypothetical protein QBC35DRAFT_29935 [Podospora australis]